MRVLAIGATGLIGPYVVRQLVLDGHDLALLQRRETNGDPAIDVRRIRGDRNAGFEWRSEAAKFSPDVVLDLIPYTERQAKELADLLRGIAGRVVALSSADVYRNYDGFRGAAAGPPDLAPLDEEAPLRERLFPYRGSDLAFPDRDDYEKILVERVLLTTHELPATILRLPAVYGPGDKQRRLRPYLRRMDDRRRAILLDREQATWRWTRGYVENVAHAIVLAIEADSAANRVFNVGDDPTPTEREWVEEISEAADWNGAIVPVDRDQLPDHLRHSFDWRFDLAINTSRIRKELGFVEPVSRLEGIRRTVRWERTLTPESLAADYAAEDAILARLRR